MRKGERTLALSERKERILGLLTDAYIRTGEPVGSKWLMEQMDNAVSSATIRNEMAELAALGYLEQPHASAGRVPTPKAFRLYIDKLMKPVSPSEALCRDIDDALEQAGSPDELIETASGLLAQETGCAAITTSPTENHATIRRLEVIPMSPYAVSLLLMTGFGMLHHRVCRLFDPVPRAVCERLTATLCAEFVGKTTADVTLPKMQRLLVSLGDEGFSCMPVLTALYELTQESERAEVLLKGQLNLLRNPAYAPERAHSLIDFLAQRAQLSRLLAAHPGGMRVVFGSEAGSPELAGSSLIVTRYVPKGGDGAIGLIGPQRMNYATVIPTLAYTARAVEHIFDQFLKE